MDSKILEKYALSLSNERLKLTIMPTEKCNFRCYYCWEDFEHGSMSQATIDGIKNLLSYRAKKDLKILNIEWFGGEPTLVEPIIVDISTHIQQLVEQYPAMVYTAAMTTNGYLLDTSFLTKFYNLGIKTFQIGLDGTKDNHNRTRILANGAETFDIIWENLLAAKSTNFNIDILICIHLFSDNYTENIPLLQKIDNTFLSDKRFSIYFKAIQRLGSKNDIYIKEVVNEEERNMIDYLQQFITNKQQIIKINPDIFVCFAAEPNAMIIRANGSINKCIVALNESYNQVGKLNTDGTLALNQKKFLSWSKGFQTSDINQIGCPNNFMK